MSSSDSRRDLVRLARQAGAYLTIPMVLAGGPAVGLFIGRFLDARFGTDPAGSAAGVGIGLIAGIIETVRLFRYAQRQSDS